MLLILLIILGGLMAYVRLAPLDPGVWHVPIAGDQNLDLAGGTLRLVAGGPPELRRLDTEMRALPRTRRIAGAPGDGRVTYVTRSWFWGFPDLTTVELRGEGQIAVFGRLRFGRSDLGVNKRRIDKLLNRSGLG